VVLTKGILVTSASFCLPRTTTLSLVPALSWGFLTYPMAMFFFRHGLKAPLVISPTCRQMQILQYTPAALCGWTALLDVSRKEVRRVSKSSREIAVYKKWKNHLFDCPRPIQFASTKPSIGIHSSCRCSSLN